MPERIPWLKSQVPILSVGGTRTSEDADERREAKAFYNSARWKRMRLQVLAESPLCEDCLTRRVTTAAAHVHHIEERRDRPDLAFTRSNLQALCPSCHNRKRRGQHRG